MAAAELVQRLPLPVLLCLLLLVLCLLVHNGCKADTSTGYPGCPYGGVWETSVEKCFMVLKSDHGESGYESVYEAAMECRSVGAMIASVETEAVRKTVTELIEQPTNRHAFEQVYIGLNDIKKENDFTWFDGSHHHRNRDTWDLGEPNTGNYAYEEDCVVLRMMKRHKKSHWHDYPCCTSASIKGVLCQMDRQQLEEEQSGTSNTKMRFPEVELLAKTCNINRCSSIECLNGGSCVNEEGSYWCRCPLGYSGALCENDVDECLEATCLNNATCVDLVGKFQCVCGKDFVGPSCETAICPEVVVIENSESEGQLLAEGSTVSYACNPGYSFPPELSGQTRIELVCSGHKWAIAVQGNILNYSLDLLQCRPICDEPLSFNNSWRTEVSLYEGSAVNYTCNETFDFAGEFKGQEFVGFICSEHKWRLIRDSGADFDSVMKPNFIVCEPVCPEPITLANSTRTGNNVSEGSTVRYTCEYGFRFPKRLNFLELKCERHNWTIVVQSEEENTTESYDYDTCRPSLKHSEQDKNGFPQCQAILCPPFPTWKGIRTENESRMVGAVIHYNCTERKQFVVDANKAFLTSECLLNETWIPDFQRCKYSDEELAKKIEPKEARGAVAIGTVAIVFLSLELALVVLMDIDHLIRHAKMLKENVASGFRRLIGAKQ